MDYIKKQGAYEEFDLVGSSWEFDDVQKEIRRVDMVKKNKSYADFKKGEKIEVQTDFGIFTGTITETTKDSYKISLDNEDKQITVSKEDKNCITSCLEDDDREMKIELNELYPDDVLVSNSCLVLGKETDNGYAMIKISKDGTNYILTYDSCADSELKDYDLTSKSYLNTTFANEEIIYDKQEVFANKDDLVNFVFEQESIF